MTTKQTESINVTESEKKSTPPTQSQRKRPRLPDGVDAPCKRHRLATSVKLCDQIRNKERNERWRREASIDAANAKSVEGLKRTFACEELDLSCINFMWEKQPSKERLIEQFDKCCHELIAKGTQAFQHVAWPTISQVLINWVGNEDVSDDKQYLVDASKLDRMDRELLSIYKHVSSAHGSRAQHVWLSWLQLRLKHWGAQVQNLPFQEQNAPFVSYDTIGIEGNAIMGPPTVLTGNTLLINILGYL